MFGVISESGALTIDLQFRDKLYQIINSQKFSDNLGHPHPDI